MTTLNTDWREDTIRKYLAKQSGYVGDTYDLTTVCLDGWFDLKEFADLLLDTERTWPTPLHDDIKEYLLQFPDDKELLIKKVEHLLAVTVEKERTHFVERDDTVQLCKGYIKIGNTIYKPTDDGWDVAETKP